MKRAIVSVINDLVTDQRVHRHCLTLQGAGFDVLLIGRIHDGSLPLEVRSYRTHRMRLPFDRGPLFYASFNIALLFQLLFRRADLLFANDLDTLLPNFIVSRIKRSRLIYDSHEFFTEVPELVHRPRTRAVWEWLEGLLVPRLQHAFTVSLAIADAYSVKYGVRFQVVRNMPRLGERPPAEPEQPPVILYQGAVNLGRGIDLAIRAMQYLDSAVLRIAGTGDVLEDMLRLTQELNLTDRVQFLGRVPFAQLADITRTASIGLSIEEDLGLNYRHALPNKLFDYMHAGVPVLVSDLPAMRQMVEDHGVGEVLLSRGPGHLSEQLKSMLDIGKQATWRANCRNAAKQLNWQSEVRVLEKILAGN
ncbi:MAG: glycosyltransferase [Flavobacteriales bacterium]|nr:glycosyltransferase [Flavobacteriales bacterium]